MHYKIPLFDLNYDEKEEEAVLETLRSKWISMGTKTTEFETLFSHMLRVEYALAVCNCTAGLHLAMKLLEIGSNDEVICPALTFVATINAIRYVDAIPVFTDIKSFEDLTIDPIDIEKRITRKTKAIVVMHYGGFSCDMDFIIDLAKKYNLKIIEDACHAPLSEYKGEKLGTLGDIGCFSFFSNKNISTGEGGMLVTNNEELYKKAKLLRSHGMTTLSYERSKGHSTAYDVVELGYNYRIDDIRSSVGIVQLAKIQSDIEKRAEVRKIYQKLLGNVATIILPFRDYDERASNYIFPIILRNSTFKVRNSIRTQLDLNGIQTSIHYPAVHKFSIYEKYRKILPLTEYASDNLISLPMFSALKHEDIDFICRVLLKALSQI